MKISILISSYNKGAYIDECLQSCLNQTHRDFEIILLCWLPNQMAPIHGHEGEKCWFKVISGSLQICNYSIKSLNPLDLKLEEEINATKGYLDGPADIHSIENCSNKPVITLHIYANPYDTCTVYNLKEKRIDKLKMSSTTKSHI